MTTADNCSSFESSSAGTCAARELRKLARLIIGQPQADKPKQKGRPKTFRKEIICSCQDLIEELDGRPILVEELASRANVSERTLRRAFHQYFGIGPARYLQLRQLHQVHRALKAEEFGAVSVSEVLLQQGVWEFGRFASRYRQLFGELPSETLRRQNKKIFGHF